MIINFNKVGYFIIIVLLLLTIGIFTARAEQGQTQAGNTIFIPIVQNNPISGRLIAGRVLSPQNAPISGVTLRTDQGQVVVTDQNGDYSINVYKDGIYTITPSLGSVAFSPPSSSVVVPPDVAKLNFTALLACSEAIINGGFENNTGWDIPVTEYSAGYSTAEAHTGGRSLRTGITSLNDNTYSYSSARQKVTIPAGTTSAYLNFWVKPFSGGTQALSLPNSPEIGSPLAEVPMAGDVQYVLILDNNSNIIKTLVWQLSNSRTWTEYQFSLVAYAGQSIWLHFGTYNDGADGISSMFVDDVSLSICPGGSPTPSPTPGPCTNLFNNPGFEAASDWEIPLTAFPAGYSTAQAHSGSRSMRTGILKLSDNTFSYSDFRQAVRVPSGTAAVTARFWLYTLSGNTNLLAEPAFIAPTGRPFNETPLSGDLQYVLILDRYQNWIDTLVWQRSDQGYWRYYEFDLRRYAGQTIYLQFGTYNDGVNDITSMFVDDASLDNCVTTPTPVPTPTATPSPGPCTELIVNNKFDNNTGWEILNTNYPASYSNAQYHTAFRSMQTGIVNPSDNAYSYSDFRQVVTIPSNARHVTLGTWLYPVSGESPQGNLSMPLLTEHFGLEAMASDVQYLLVLDQNQGWIDTLLWMRTNSQSWTNMQFDLSRYAGWKIMLQWGTYNNGTSGITAMYVDDVTLQACP